MSRKVSDYVNLGITLDLIEYQLTSATSRRHPSDCLVLPEHRHYRALEQDVQNMTPVADCDLPSASATSP